MIVDILYEVSRISLVSCQACADPQTEARPGKEEPGAEVLRAAVLLCVFLSHNLASWPRQLALVTVGTNVRKAIVRVLRVQRYSLPRTLVPVGKGKTREPRNVECSV